MKTMKNYEQFINENLDPNDETILKMSEGTKAAFLGFFGTINIPHKIELEVKEGIYGGKPYINQHIIIRDLTREDVIDLTGINNIRNHAYMSQKQINDFNKTNKNFKIETGGATVRQNILDQFEMFELSFRTTDSKYINDSTTLVAELLLHYGRSYQGIAKVEYPNPEHNWSNYLKRQTSKN